MDFDQLQRVWDAQRQSPLYAVNETALLAMVQRRNAASAHRAAAHYRREIAIGAACALLMLVAALLLATQAVPAGWLRAEPDRWAVPALGLAAALWGYFVLYLRQARQALARAGEAFESDLPGEVRRALARLEFQIAHARGIVLRGFVPVWIAAGLWVAVLFRLVDSPPAGYLLLATLWATAFVGQTRAQLHAISRRHEPERRELLALQRQLDEAR